MIDHVYIVDLRHTQEQSSPKGVILGGNAPTHLVLTSPYYTANTPEGGHKIKEPSPESLARKAAIHALAIENQKKREAEAEARRQATKEAAARDKALRHEISQRLKAEYREKKQAEAEAERARKAAQLLLNTGTKRKRRGVDRRVQGQKPIRKITKAQEKHERATPPEGYISQAKAAKELGVCPSTVSKYIHSGNVRSVRKGKFVYLVLEDAAKVKRDSELKSRENGRMFAVRMAMERESTESCKQWDI